MSEPQPQPRARANNNDPQQEEKKAVWRRSVNCTEDERANGGRWAFIKISGSDGLKLARIECAVTGGTDAVVAQLMSSVTPVHRRCDSSLKAFKVIVLHPDEYTIDFLRDAPGWCGASHEKDFVKRYVQGLYGCAGHMIDASLNRFRPDEEDGGLL